MSYPSLLAAASLVALALSPLPAVTATTAPAPEPAAEWAESPLSMTELEALRQDVEHLQQNFYQASPEVRRRWIESVRERRQRLDLQEDQAASAPARVRASRATAPELPRGTVIRAQGRERAVD